jgi:hypothetical protein
MCPNPMNLEAMDQGMQQQCWPAMAVHGERLNHEFSRIF